jgi:hypothetical protein
MFVVANGGPTPAYVRAPYHKLPSTKKRLLEVEA